MQLKKKPYTLKLDPDLLAALRRIKEDDGIAESEQIRRGVKLWLATKGIIVGATQRKQPVATGRRTSIKRTRARRHG